MKTEVNDMRTVVSDFGVGKYRVLKLDGEKPMKPYNAYRIDGVVFPIVPLYDAMNCIAIESADSFTGKTVEFI
jgi:hypothetical protein